jgi:transposase
MAAYSLDLRKRIVDAIERGIGTRSEVAELFGVHETFVYILLRQKRERGDIAQLPHGGGAQAKLNEGQLMILTDLVTQSPDFAAGSCIVAIPSHSFENRCSQRRDQSGG